MVDSGLPYNYYVQSTIISTGEQVSSTVSSTALHAGPSSEGTTYYIPYLFM